MSTTVAVIAIKGNHLDNTDVIFEALNYVDTHDDKHFETYPEFEAYLYDNYNDLALRETFIRGIWLDNGWTMLMDPDMADPICEETLKIVSQQLNTPVCGLVLEPTINSFVFAYFNTSRQRYFRMDDYAVKDNSGNPLPQEAGLNLNESVTEQDLLMLARNFGFDPEPRDLKTRFTIKALNFTESFRKEVEKYAPVIQPELPVALAKKAWWRFW